MPLGKSSQGYYWDPQGLVSPLVFGVVAGPSRSLVPITKASLMLA